MLKKWILFFCLTFLSSPSFAAYSPMAFSLATPVQFPDSDYNVSGLRFSLLWGSHRDVYGLDLGGVGNITNQRFVGTPISGVFNYTKGETTALGVQLAGLTNFNLQKTHVYGLQLALGLNYNKAASEVIGLQLAAVNLAEFTDVYGVQIGVYNRAHSVRGLQIGLVNVADNLRGLQIGLVNFHYTGLFYVSPFVNFGF